MTCLHFLIWVCQDLHHFLRHVVLLLHRSRWVREELLLVGELDRYEEKLLEEWEIRFERVQDRLRNHALEDEKREAGQRLYEWVETDVSIPIRPRCNDYFITRGSYQILADHKQVGWHPEFKARLSQLFEMQEVMQ
jgi:hypothetical protein